MGCIMMQIYRMMRHGRPCLEILDKLKRLEMPLQGKTRMLIAPIPTIITKKIIQATEAATCRSRTPARRVCITFVSFQLNLDSLLFRWGDLLRSHGLIS